MIFIVYFHIVALKNYNAKIMNNKILTRIVWFTFVLGFLYAFGICNCCIGKLEGCFELGINLTGKHNSYLILNCLMVEC